MINCVAYLHKLILLPYRYIPYVINIHNGTQIINMHHPSTPRPPMTTNAYVINIHNGTQFINISPFHATLTDDNECTLTDAAAGFNIDAGNILNHSVNTHCFCKNICQRIYYISEKLCLQNIVTERV